jgi:hypothetical protein
MSVYNIGCVRRAVSSDTAKISILCYPTQRQKVITAFTMENLFLFDGGDYTMGCSSEGYTLEDKKASDSWDIHPLLRTRDSEGVTPFSPFAFILTAAQIRPPFNGCSPDEVQARIATENPCPSHCERTKYSFSMNLSKHWQADIDAPVCQEFPYSYAIANFLWWHQEQGGLLVTMGDTMMVPLVGCFMSMDVMALQEKLEGSIIPALNAMISMKYLAHPAQNRYTRAHALHTNSNTHCVHFELTRHTNLLFRLCVHSGSGRAMLATCDSRR